MENQNGPGVLSPGHKNIWLGEEPSIWTSNHRGAERSEALSILGTLLDQPRWLAPRHLYDDKGSALFDRICELPEYYPTRTESAILKERAGAIVRAARADLIVELGAGTSQKTLHLLHEQEKQRPGGAFAPIDVSLASLKIARDAVEKKFPRLLFHGL
ncbi:MAG TPA: L-histidine N(alpha)-methyltransferase, partial [Candidatus Binatia bacterium]